MKGKIIVIEGVDSVGKHTQAEALKKNLISAGYKVFMHSFPSYEENQSVLAKMYLNGEFGKGADCIDYKVASSFFAVDRIATYYLTLKEKLEQGYILILDRYTTSNMVHQAGKFKNKKDIIKAMKWIGNYEFNELGLPKPNVVFYLTVEKQIRELLLDKRRSDDVKDIHEKDKEYLAKCSKAGLIVAKENAWNIITCNNSKSMRSVESISEEIYNIILNKLK